MFDIITSRDFLDKLEAEYADFKAQPDSTRHALNCIMTAYHLHEWVWGDWLKTDYETWQKIGGIRDKDSFKARLAELWPGMTVVEELTNGTKHFGKRSFETVRFAGYGSGPYSVGPYGRPYLLIDYGGDCVPRYQTAEQLIDAAVIFWRGFFDSYVREAADP
jgi:hypothetical protein